MWLYICQYLWYTILIFHVIYSPNPGIRAFTIPNSSNSFSMYYKSSGRFIHVTRGDLLQHGSLLRKKHFIAEIESSDTQLINLGYKTVYS